MSARLGRVHHRLEERWSPYKVQYSRAYQENEYFNDEYFLPYGTAPANNESFHDIVDRRVTENRNHNSVSRKTRVQLDKDLSGYMSESRSRRVLDRELEEYRSKGEGRYDEDLSRFKRKPLVKHGDNIKQ